MLSTGAFNALLKTLEEPPAHVIFILATTEVQKVPATIISRTQRFDFKRIATETIVARMQYILKDMQITFDDAALELIANAAAGGMRDALSILDQVLSFGADHVTLANALTVTGSLSGDTLTKYLRAVNAGETGNGLTIVQTELAAYDFVNDPAAKVRVLDQIEQKLMALGKLSRTDYQAILARRTQAVTAVLKNSQAS